MPRIEMISMNGICFMIASSNVEILAPWLLETLERCTEGSYPGFQPSIRLWPMFNGEKPDWPTSAVENSRVHSVGTLRELIEALEGIEERVSRETTGESQQ